MPRAVFLDRDGVINRKAPEGQYITRWDDFEFLPQVPEAIRILNRTNFLVIVVTNQRCVAKGLLAADELEAIHRRMLQELASLHATIDAVYFCPHDNDSQCACRKPLPGMLIRAAKEHSLELPQSWMIGDSEGDVLAGRSAGCKTVRILRPGASPQTGSDLIANSLCEAAEKIVSI
ncbi:MAG TPA: HAD family hydrolase [Dongiaceae bacterium]|nr:HAD family hydrolase [Dongiaceae bacterium]